MLKTLVKATARSLGYEIIAIQEKNDKLFTLHEFHQSDGTFDYEHYRKVQTEGNRRKIEKVWVREPNIKFLSDYIKSLGLNPTFGICHGTRRGKEQEWFRKYLDAEVIGTEISDTATEFPNTIQWDFHDVKPEWIDSVDFIYSNSFDHSYDPESCLSGWMSCVKPGGICILEHSTLHSPSGANELDPFGAELVVMPYLITTWGKGKYYVREILAAPEKNESLGYLNYIVIQRSQAVTSGST